MELEINKELVLSTNHVPYSTQDSMRKDKYGECERIDVDMFLVDEKEMKFCTHLTKLVILAKDHGCQWLQLDSDGPIVKELKVFEW